MKTLNDFFSENTQVYFFSPSKVKEFENDEKLHQFCSEMCPTSFYPKYFYETSNIIRTLRYYLHDDATHWRHFLTYGHPNGPQFSVKTLSRLRSLLKSLMDIFYDLLVFSEYADDNGGIEPDDLYYFLMMVHCSFKHQIELLTTGFEMECEKVGFTSLKLPPYSNNDPIQAQDIRFIFKPDNT